MNPSSITIRIMTRAEQKEVLDVNAKSPIVVPPYAFVRNGDEVKFLCKLSAATIWFPGEGIPFDGNGTIDLEKGEPKTAIIDASSGKYAYSVFVKEDKEFAEGNSSPKIIVE